MATVHVPAHAFVLKDKKTVFGFIKGNSRIYGSIDATELISEVLKSKHLPYGILERGLDITQLFGTLQLSCIRLDNINVTVSEIKIFWVENSVACNIWRSVSSVNAFGSADITGLCLDVQNFQALCTCKRVGLEVPTVKCEWNEGAVGGCLQGKNFLRNKIMIISFRHDWVCRCVDGAEWHNKAPQFLGVYWYHTSSTPRVRLCGVHFEKGHSHIRTKHWIHVRWWWCTFHFWCNGNSLRTDRIYSVRALYTIPMYLALWKMCRLIAESHGEYFSGPGNRNNNSGYFIELKRSAVKKISPVGCLLKEHINELLNLRRAKLHRVFCVIKWSENWKKKARPNLRCKLQPKVCIFLYSNDQWNRLARKVYISMRAPCR